METALLSIHDKMSGRSSPTTHVGTATPAVNDSNDIISSRGVQLQSERERSTCH